MNQTQKCKNKRKGEEKGAYHAGEEERRKGWKMREKD